MDIDCLLGTVAKYGGLHFATYPRKRLMPSPSG